jgi:hypothetical protein
MEAKHTPGPWLRQGQTVYALDDSKSVNRFNFLVQGGYLHHTRYERVHTPDEELEAVARVAQAAPVLLDALLRIDARLPNFPSPDAVEEDEIAEITITLSDWRAIRAAIASATQGKSNA